MTVLNDIRLADHFPFLCLFTLVIIFSSLQQPFIHNVPFIKFCAPGVLKKKKNSFLCLSLWGFFFLYDFCFKTLSILGLFLFRFRDLNLAPRLRFNLWTSHLITESPCKKGTLSGIDVLRRSQLSELSLQDMLLCVPHAAAPSHYKSWDPSVHKQSMPLTDALVMSWGPCWYKWQV